MQDPDTESLNPGIVGDHTVRTAIQWNSQKMFFKKLIPVAMICMAAATAMAEGESPDITVQQINDRLHVLFGNGGNIGVLTSEDGIFMIDDQYAPMSDKIRAALAGISDQPVKFLINTHWHGDHTGGNESFGKTGSIIVAHDNVRQRMSKDQYIKLFDMKAPASPEVALPAITYRDRAQFFVGGEEVHVLHVRNAHTDGDSLIHFATSNALHLGDTFFNGRYPFIDRDSGGSIQGMIASADTVLAIADDQTVIIPGHGPVTDKAGLQRYRDMLATVRDQVAPLLAGGQSLEQVIAAKPSSQFDEALGGAFIRPAQFVEFVYDSLKNPPKAVGPHRHH